MAEKDVWQENIITTNKHKIIQCHHVLTLLNEDFVSVPLDLQSGVADGDEATLEVSCLALSQVVQVLQRLCEHGTLEGLHVILSL